MSRRLPTSHWVARTRARGSNPLPSRRQTENRRVLTPNRLYFVPVAQLEEHLTFNQGVAGSSPARHTQNPNSFFVPPFCWGVLNGRPFLLSGAHPVDTRHFFHYTTRRTFCQEKICTNFLSYRSQNLCNITIVFLSVICYNT